MSEQAKKSKDESLAAVQKETKGPAQVESFRSSSLEEACGYVSELFCRHGLEPINRNSKPDVRVRHAPLHETSINLLSHKVSVKINPEPFRSFYLLQIPVVGDAKIHRGAKQLEVISGKATITAPDEDIDMVWSEKCKKVILRIDRTALEKMHASLTGIAPSSPLRFEGVIDLTSGPLQSVWRMIQMVTEDLIHNEGSIFKSGLAAQHIEQTILFALLNSNINSHSNSGNHKFSTIAPHQVRIVEEYIRENAENPITVDNLVDVAGVSARTLFDNFKKFRGETPMGYVKNVRMQCVRERLMNPRSEDSVTSVAMRWGFTQLGRFSAIYKNEFGESPSQTLKKARRVS